jgi:hypothetical protein
MMRMANIYDIGDAVRVKATFSVSGTATDPTTVTLKVKDPSGTISTYTYALSEVTKETTGIYYKDIMFDEGGMWHYRWEGTGTVQAAGEGLLIVQETKF